jgi:hypothetical protein
MLLVDHPETQAALLQPLPAVAQKAKLDALATGRGRVVIVGWVAPERAEGAVAGDQPLGVAADRLFGAKALEALCRALAVEFVGVGRDIPGRRRRLEESALSRKGIEQPVGG